MDAQKRALMELRVLIADDSLPMRITLRSFVRQLGIMDVTIVSDGASARDQLKKEDFDLLLLDQDMPRLTGLELLRLVRELRPAVKIIMITASGDTKTVCAAIENGSDSYIIKPVSMRELEKKIRQVTWRDSEREARLSNLRQLIRQAESSEAWGEVQEALLVAVRHDSTSWAVLNLAGEVFERAGKDAEALKFYRRAVSLSQELLPGPLEKAARVLARHGEVGEALDLMGKALGLSHETFIGPRKLFYEELLAKAGEGEPAPAGDKENKRS